MSTFIPKSLRWQIVAALFGLVVLTIALSWGLTNLFTARDFEHLVTSEAEDQAREFAYLLEARYNLGKGFDDLEDFLVEETGIVSSVVLESEDWLDDQNVFGWDFVVAAELGLSIGEYQEAMLDASPAELAEELGIPVDQLVAAIMRLERDRFGSESEDSDMDAVYLHSALLAEAELYVEGWLQEAWEDDAEYWEEFDQPFLHEAAILVVDAQGTVLFDGTGAMMEHASEGLEDLVEGFPIRDWEDGSTVGYVLSAREPWEFSLEETAFLGQARLGLLLGGLIAAAVALGFGFWIARRISGPITALKNSAAQLASGASAQRLPVTPGELGSMSSAFNALSDSLAQQEEVRSRMISDLSHELNTPLAVLQLELEALRDGLQPQDEAVTHMLQEIALLRNLAADVGTLSENAAGLLTIQKESLVLASYLQETVGRWKVQAEGASIELVVSCTESSHAVEADPTRLSQALGNLIRNALQHTPRGGRIQIESARRPVEGLGGIWNTICVHDSGSGIEPEVLKHVFERSVRASEARTGRGLGLTIVQQIVEAHGGYVWATSSVDVGSSFCIALP